jgi:hypothetical protein
MRHLIWPLLGFMVACPSRDRHGIVDPDQKAVLAAVWAHDPAAWDTFAVFVSHASFSAENLTVQPQDPTEEVTSAIAVRATTPILLKDLVDIDSTRTIDSVPVIADQAGWQAVRRDFGDDSHIVTVTLPAFDEHRSIAVVIVFVQCGQDGCNEVRRYTVHRSTSGWQVAPESPMIIRG